GVGVSVGRHVCELSLCHDEKRRWRTDRRGGGAGAPTPPWRAGETYQVALAAKGVTGSAYVDGVRAGPLECALVPAEAAVADEEVPLPPQDELLYVVFFWRRREPRDADERLSVQPAVAGRGAEGAREGEAQRPGDGGGGVDVGRCAGRARKRIRRRPGRQRQARRFRAWASVRVVAAAASAGAVGVCLSSLSRRTKQRGRRRCDLRWNACRVCFTLVNRLLQWSPFFSFYVK
ncbi:uncharacterized protein Tco025E_09265, partial [Trypanosoma conorhini]